MSRSAPCRRNYYNPIIFKSKVFAPKKTSPSLCPGRAVKRPVLLDFALLGVAVGVVRETRAHRGRDLRRRIDDGYTSRFQRLTFSRVAAGVAGDDRARVA